MKDIMNGSTNAGSESADIFEMKDLLDYTEDKEFEALIKNGLDASFDAEQIFVSEDLIAKTLSRINAAPASEDMTASAETIASLDKVVSTDKNASKKRFWRTASGIAAALLVGVVGIGFLARGIGASKGGSMTVSDESAKPASANRGFMAEGVLDTCAPGMSVAESAAEECEESFFDEQKTSASKDSMSLGTTSSDINFTTSVGSIAESAPGYSEDGMDAGASDSIDDMDTVTIETDDLYEPGVGLPADWDAQPGLIIDNTLSYGEIADSNDSMITDFSSNSAALFGKAILCGEEKLEAVMDYIDGLGGELAESGTMNLPDYSLLEGKRPLAEVLVSIDERSLTYVIVDIYDDYYEYAYMPAYSSNSNDYLTELYRIEDAEQAAQELIDMAAELALTE